MSRPDDNLAFNALQAETNRPEQQLVCSRLRPATFQSAFGTLVAKRWNQRLWMQATHIGGLHTLINTEFSE